MGPGFAPPQPIPPIATKESPGGHKLSDIGASLHASALGPTTTAYGATS